MIIKTKAVKIKENVDLKKLEEFGYKFDSGNFLDNCYFKDFAGFTYYVDIKDRIFRFVCEDDYGYIYSKDDFFLKDLQKANILETTIVDEIL